MRPHTDLTIYSDFLEIVWWYSVVDFIKGFYKIQVYNNIAWLLSLLNLYLANLYNQIKISFFFLFFKCVKTHLVKDNIMI